MITLTNNSKNIRPANTLPEQHQPLWVYITAMAHHIDGALRIVQQSGLGRRAFDLPNPR